MKSFLSRFSTLISFVLSGFDRLRLCGESRLLNHPRGVDSYLVQQRILRKDFADHAQELTHKLRQQTESLALQQGVPLLYLNSPEIDKQEAVRELVRKHSPQKVDPVQANDNSPDSPLVFPNGSSDGRIALLSCVEPCRFYRYFKNDQGAFQFRKQTGKCLAYYHYFDHPRFGLCHVRMQTWFPFPIHIAINGREWLCRQLDHAKLGYERNDNLILRVDDPLRAQEMFDQQVHADWPKLLTDLVQPIQPLWDYLHQQVNTPYHWMAEQTEWATDFVFKDPADLERLYPRWIRHGLETLSCQDILRYFKKNPNRCSAENVRVSYIDREEGPYAGTRLKFWYKTNTSKFYNKGDSAGAALRVEATINKANEFSAFRHTEKQDPSEPKAWHEMRKSVEDMPRRAEVSQAIVNRTAESLASVVEPTPLGELLKPLGKPVVEQGKRKARALNPLTGLDGELLRLIANGDYLINGFRNRDLRQALDGDAPDEATRKKQASAVTRKLGLLRAHGLIVKVAKTHRYRLSAQGTRISTALSFANSCDVNTLANPPHFSSSAA